jgi:regulator of PEP synthase PpsR (kinase-PPPase family)
LGGVTKDYVDLEMVSLELMHARKIFNEHPGWSIIKVTNKPIEEIAFEILEILRK